MEDNKIQPEEIEHILTTCFICRKIYDEFGFTQEWRLGVKDILDIIISLKIAPKKTENILLGFQAWQLYKGYLNHEKVKNGMIKEYLNEKL